MLVLGGITQKWCFFFKKKDELLGEIDKKVVEELIKKEKQLQKKKGNFRKSHSFDLIHRGAREPKSCLDWRPES